MHIRQQGDQFIAQVDGKDVGQLHFYPHNSGSIIVDHTYVDPEMRGLKIAQQLLDAVAQYARQEKVSIVPQCSYVAAAFKRFPHKYQDVHATL